MFAYLIIYYDLLYWVNLGPLFLHAGDVLGVLDLRNTLIFCERDQEVRGCIVDKY